MGKLSKTITLHVPVEVVYQSLKDKSGFDYGQDLRQGLTPPTHVVKDVQNSLYAVETSAWGTKLEAEYLFHHIGEDSCEITVTFKFRLALGATVRQSMLSEIGALKTLEFGYKAGLQKQAKKQI
jgi:hypothetical protein